MSRNLNPGIPRGAEVAGWDGGEVGYLIENLTDIK